METKPVEQLNRQEILKILQQRHLHISDMYSLSQDELVRVYKSFAMPLSRRPQSNKIFPNPQGDGQRCLNVDYDQSMPLVTETRAPMEVECTSEKMRECEILANVNLNSVAEKRRQTDIDLTADYQYHLSKATKRIRIDSYY